MAVFEVVPVAEYHIEYVAAHMRGADVDEIAASSGDSPLEALRRSVARSDVSWCALADNVPFVIFGVGTVNILARTAVPWLLGTDEVVTHYRHFAKQSRLWLAELSCRYSHLINAVDDRNELSKRWLKWLGFTFSEKKKIGASNILFHVFELRSSHV